jgi:hypothetical protein
VRSTTNGTTIVLDLAQGATLYAFGNIMYNIGNGGNGFTPQFTAAGDTLVIYFVNNTFDNTLPLSVYTSTFSGSAGGGTMNWHVCNNHMIAYTGPMSNVITTQSGFSLTTNVTEDCGAATEIFQTESVANGQGYTTSNNYQPTSSSDATVHAGYNLSSSCSTYSPDSALCNGTTGGVTNTAGSGTIPTLYISSPPSRGTTWDAGAYQFSASMSTAALPSSSGVVGTSLLFRQIVVFSLILALTQGAFYVASRHGRAAAPRIQPEVNVSSGPRHGAGLLGGVLSSSDAQSADSEVRGNGTRQGNRNGEGQNDA